MYPDQLGTQDSKQIKLGINRLPIEDWVSILHFNKHKIKNITEKCDISSIRIEFKNSTKDGNIKLPPEHKNCQEVKEIGK